MASNYGGVTERFPNLIEILSESDNDDNSRTNSTYDEDDGLKGQLLSMMMVGNQSRG